MFRQCDVFVDVHGADCRSAREPPTVNCPRQTPGVLRLNTEPNSTSVDNFIAVVLVLTTGPLASGQYFAVK
jgi:hypothetical protein